MQFDFNNFDIGDPPDVVRIGDVSTLLKEAFKGCRVETPPALGSNSFHATATFANREVRVILTGSPTSGDREIHVRYRTSSPPTKGSKTVYNTVLEAKTSSSAELWFTILHIRNGVTREIEDLYNAVCGKTYGNAGDSI